MTSMIGPMSQHGPPPSRRPTKVLLAEPSGFCAGVDMAIKALVWMTKIFDPPCIAITR